MYILKLDCDRPGDFVSVLAAITDLALADQQGGRTFPKAPNGAETGRKLVGRVAQLSGPIHHVSYRGAHLKAFTAVYNAIRLTERLTEKKVVA